MVFSVRERRKGMASMLVSTPGSTDRSEKDSFMMTMTFTGRVVPSGSTTLTDTSSLMFSPPRAFSVSSE